jgi:hypothetical protein
MGKILFFVPKQEAAERKPLRPGERATIILFPGVRYERLDDPPAPARRGTGKIRPTRRPGASPLRK